MDQALLDKLIEDLKGLGHLTPSDEKIGTVKGAYDTTVAAIHQVELITGDAGVALVGTTKKELVIAVIDRFVHIPWVPQWLMNELLSYGIDLTVAFVNKKFGNDWVTKVVAGV